MPSAGPAACANLLLNFRAKEGYAHYHPAKFD